MAYLATPAVAAAIFTTLNVSALTTLATGGVSDAPAQNTAYPYVWFGLREREMRGFGTGSLPELELRVHVESQYQGWAEARTIIQKVIQLLRDAALTVTGYSHCGRVFYDETVELEAPEMVNGIPTREAVAMFRIYVEES